MKKTVIALCMALILTYSVSAASYPSWVITQPKSDTELFALGIASSKNKQLGINSASSLARSELSRVISVRVINQLVSTTEQSGRDVSSYSGSVSAQITETVMKGAKISNVYEDTSTKIPTYYVLVSIAITDLKQSFSTLTEASLRDMLSGSSSPLDSIDHTPVVTKDASVTEAAVSAKSALKSPEPKSGKKVPAWVSKFPASGDYYIGIGQGNQLKTAQDGAIAMIVTQIRSKVQAEMKTFMQETNGTTEESFSQVIKTSLMENVEDVEYVDAFLSETDGMYYAYYRLNIEQYKKKQEEKLAAAKTAALDLLNRASTVTDPSLTLKQLLTGYVTIAPFISKNVRAEYQGREVVLASELLAQLQELMQEIQIVPEKTQYEASLINQAPYEAVFTVSRNSTPLKYIPFTFTAVNGDLNMVKRSESDARGNVRTVINSSGKTAGLKTLKITPDILSFIKDNVDEETAFLYLSTISGLGLPGSEVLIRVNPPVFTLETALSGSMEKHKERADIAFSEFKNAFEKKMNAKFSTNPGNFVIRLNVLSTTNLSEMSGQYFTRMTVTVSIIDTAKGEEIYTKSTPEIKGGSITEVKSVQSAVEKYMSGHNGVFVDEVIAFFSKGN